MSTGAQMLLDRVRAATSDEYTIDGELGRGGMAAVYLARDIALQRRVAIKVMLPDLIDVEGIEERFVIEARTAAHLDHPGIVTVYSVKQRAGLLFIVMKYIEGRTLESVLDAEHALEAPVVTTIVSQVADALHFAHGEGVVHRDVKPSNILIDTRGRPVVTDFGIAKISSGRSLTVTGAMIGTPAYMSPEQCRGLPATTASDQYSLGVMAYEMLARRLPFEGTLFELIHAHSDTAPPPIREFTPGLDPELEETVLRMLAKNPRDRWPSMSEVAKRLAQAGPPQRRTSEIQASIAALAREVDAAAPRRPAASIDLSGAATEVATTPAPALVITPAEPAIEVGESIQMRLSESSGASLGGIRIAWKSEDPSIAVVDATGMVTGKSVGMAKITASGGLAFGRVAVNVKPASVDTLVVTPQSPEIETDNELQFVATALDARGNPVVGQAILWTSSDVSVCAVSQQGRAIGTAPGRAEIIANCGSVRGTANVRVRPPAVERLVVDPVDPNLEVEEKLRLTASVLGPLERTLRGRAITWRSSAPTIVTVTNDGLIEGVSPGTAAIIATCEGKEGIASVTVRNQPVVAVRLQPARLQLEVGRSMQLQGVAEDRRGRSVPGSGLEWHSDDDQIALVDASGKVHGVREGRTVVRAISGDVTSTLDVTVVARPAAQLRIESHPPELRVGSFLSLDATVLDADGASLPERVVTWTSSDPKIVAIGPDGSCEAKRPGSVRITAACERARGTTKLSVPSAAPVGGAVPAGGTWQAAQAGGDDPSTVLIEAATAPATRPASGPASPARRPNRGVMFGGAAALLVIATVFVVVVKGGDPQLPDPGEGGTATPEQTTLQVGQTGVTGNEGGTPPGQGGGGTEPPDRGVGGVQMAGPPAATGSTGATGRTGQVADAQAARAAATPPTGATGRTGGAGATGGTGGQRQGAGALPPPDTTQATKQVTATPPVDSAALAAAAAAAAARRAADSVAAARRQLLCGSSATAERALNEALSASTAARLDALYVPRDAADTLEKTALTNAIRNAQNLRATLRVVGNEAAGDPCSWVVQVDLNWVSFAGRPQRRASQMRMELDELGGQARVRRLFGATSR